MGERNRIEVSKREARTWHWQTARSLGLDQGMILWRFARSGPRDEAAQWPLASKHLANSNGIDVLEIIALRRGSRAGVEQQIGERIRAAGYQPVIAGQSPSGWWSDPGKAGTPCMAATAADAGQQIEGTWVVVPPDMTGLRFLLQAGTASGPDGSRITAGQAQRRKTRAVMRRERRSGERPLAWRIAAVPLHVLGALLIACMMAIGLPLMERRVRRDLERHVQRLGLADGTVVNDRLIPGVFTSDGRAIETLVHGPWQDVFRDVRDRAYECGYNVQSFGRDPATRLSAPAAIPDAPPQNLEFVPPSWANRAQGQVTFPRLRVSVYPAGDRLAPNGPQVPPGQTGLKLIL
ncbi:MAG: hypothetical protein LBV34_08120 [Nocardiopsaceae bacterium]|jgi:hypothetical protein|nr:hypothetical protein [Nocardiopsaceae bacterium]